MIGTDLNLTLPSTSETMATNIARIATALSAIETSLTDKATPAGIDINTTLEMNGNALTEVTSVQFAAGNTPSVAGSLYYFNGAWYVRDAVGPIQLTTNGQLNAASVGGIVGDYGGVNPAKVTYDDASGEYRFTEDTGIYADLVADDLVLNGSAGTVRMGVDSAITTARTFNFKSLPASGISLLVYDASDSGLKDNNATRATNEAKLTNLDYSGTLKHGDRTLTLSGLDAATSNSSVNRIHTGGTYISSAGAVDLFYSFPLTTGDRIKSVTFSVFGDGVADITAAEVRVTSAAVLNTVIGTTTVTNPAAAWVDIPIDCTDTVLAAAETVYLIIQINAASLRVANVRVLYDRP